MGSVKSLNRLSGQFFTLIESNKKSLSKATLRSFQPEISESGFYFPGPFPTFAGSKLKNKYEQLRDGIHFKSRFV